MPSPQAPPTTRQDRIAPEVFDLPVEAIRRGDYTDRYFVRARDILRDEGRHPAVTMQVFLKEEAVLAGTDEALALLRLCLTEGYDFGDLEVWSLPEGAPVEPWETVMHVTGPYVAFAHLETLYLSVLARGTRIATRTREVVEAAWPAGILYFPARHDHWRLQAADGWAARVAGATAVSTDVQGSRWGGEGMGTIPHALIAAFDGDTVAATEAFARQMPDDVRIISLVDFDNDSVGTSLAVARALGERLHGVRLDTSGSLVDRSLHDRMADFDPRGVNPPLVRNVRAALDAEGFDHVRIVVSGGFDAEKIRRFRRLDLPVDSYGVGSSLIGGGYDFTADVVRVEGRPVAKVGRVYRSNPRLERVR